MLLRFISNLLQNGGEETLKLFLLLLKLIAKLLDLAFIVLALLIWERPEVLETDHWVRPAGGGPVGERLVVREVWL